MLANEENNSLNPVPERAARCEESERICPVMGSVIPEPVRDTEDSGDTAGPPGPGPAESPPHEGDRLEPEPVEPGEVVGGPVSCGSCNTDTG